METKLQAALDASEPHSPVLNKHVNACIWGPFGSGKTTLAGQLIRRRGLWIAADTSYIALENVGLLDKIEVIEYDSPAQLKAIAFAIEEQQPRYREFDLVCPDTISQMTVQFTDWLTEAYDFPGSKHREKAISKLKGNERLEEIDVPGLPDYHITRNKFRPPIMALCRAPVDVVFTAHLRNPSFMEDGVKALLRRPALIESVYNVLAQEVNIMGMMERVGGKSSITFESSKRTAAKSQIGDLDGKKFDNAEDIIPIIRKWQS